VLLATLLVAAGLAFTPMMPPRAVAAEPGALVSIRLDSLQPSLPERDSEVTITGTVTNTSKKRLLRPRAYFWRNQAPITDNEGFDQALDSPSNEPLGARYIPAFDDLFDDDDDPYLDPDASADFTLEVKVSDLDLSPTSGLYLMGVHVLQNESAPAIGRARVLVPVISKKPRNSLQMTTVVALNSRPSLVGRGLFADDHLAKEIAPGGRLDTLLRAADSDDVSYAVDPALVEEVQTMRSGYEVLEDGRHDGSGRAAAEQWLARFSRLSEDRDGYRLLYGSPDIAALTHAGQLDILGASVAAARTVTATQSLPLLVWPGGGVADAETVAAAERLKPAAVLLSDASTRSRAPLLRGPAVPGVVPAAIVNYTTAAFGGGGPGPEPSDTPVHVQQRLLSESWLQASTRPAGTTMGRVRVVSTAAQAESGDDDSLEASWIKRTTLTKLLKSSPSKWDNVLHYTETNRDKELSASQLASLDRLALSWRTWQDLMVDRTAAKAGVNTVLARAASVRLRGAGASFKSFLAPQQSELDQRLNAIQISASPQVLIPKSSVRFPITIRNTLLPSDDPANPTANQVRVQLRFISANAQRLTVQPIGLQTIEAGQNFPGSALVEARTNGTVRVTAQLYTASGLKVGQPRFIDVKATQAGTVGWLIAIAAGVVLLGTTALRIRQVTRARAAAAGTGEPPPPDATKSAPPQDVPHPDLVPQRAPTSGPGHGAAESIDV
jgi:hypothetical protein